MAKDLGISESCLRNWVQQADIGESRRKGVTTAELTKLRQENRVLKMERDILSSSLTSP